MLKLTTGSTVSFRLVETTVMAKNFNNVKVLTGDTVYSIARGSDPELQTHHESLYPYFKDKVDNVNSPTAYNYAIVELPNGTVVPVGLPWIDETTVQVVDTKRASLEISNYRVEWEAPIRDLLNNLGASYTLTLGKTTT